MRYVKTFFSFLFISLSFLPSLFSLCLVHFLLLFLLLLLLPRWFEKFENFSSFATRTRWNQRRVSPVDRVWLRVEFPSSFLPPLSRSVSVSLFLPSFLPFQGSWSCCWWSGLVDGVTRGFFLFVLFCAISLLPSDRWRWSRWRMNLGSSPGRRVEDRSKFFFFFRSSFFEERNIILKTWLRLKKILTSIRSKRIDFWVEIFSFSIDSGDDNFFFFF